MSAPRNHQVLIVGGGFAGLAVARALAGQPCDVTLVDRRNYHLFQPLLYQVATGGLSPANIAYPLRSVLRRQRNARVLLGEVTELDVAGRQVLLGDGGALPYDTLVLATGCGHNYFGHPEWERHAPGLKTIEEATRIRARVLGAFEAAERDPEQAPALLTFVVIGAGPTGVELAGALAEIARATLASDFRAIDPTGARILLLELADRVLPPFHAELSERARRSLERLGVEVMTGTRVTEIDEASVAFEQDGRPQTVPTRTVLWAAGTRASPLGELLARSAGARTDRGGRVVVGPDLSVAGHPELMVLGDLASFAHGLERPLPGVATVAIQQGQYVGGLIVSRLEGRHAPPPFRYRDPGSMATIGRAAAVADLGWLRCAGYPAWLIWLFVHLINLVGYQNRLLVLIQWAYNYWTRNRAARLITSREHKPFRS